MQGADSDLLGDRDDTLLPPCTARCTQAATPVFPALYKCVEGVRQQLQPHKTVVVLPFRLSTCLTALNTTRGREVKEQPHKTVVVSHFSTSPVQIQCMEAVTCLVVNVTTRQQLSMAWEEIHYAIYLYSGSHLGLAKLLYNTHCWLSPSLAGSQVILANIATNIILLQTILHKSSLVLLNVIINTLYCRPYCPTTTWSISRKA